MLLGGRGKEGVGEGREAQGAGRFQDQPGAHRLAPDPTEISEGVLASFTHLGKDVLLYLANTTTVHWRKFLHFHFVLLGLFFPFGSVRFLLQQGSPSQ